MFWALSPINTLQKHICNPEALLRFDNSHPDPISDIPSQNCSKMSRMGELLFNLLLIMLESCYSFAFASRRRFLIRLAIELGEGWEFPKPRDKSSCTCTWIYYWYAYMCIYLYYACYVYINIYTYWCIYKVGSTIPSNWLDFKSSTSTVWLIFISKWNNYSLVSMNLSGIGPPNAYSSSGVRCNILGRCLESFRLGWESIARVASCSSYTYLYWTHGL